MTSSDIKPSQQAPGRCPICGAPAVHAVRPFCSARCADIDLGRWVAGAYVISGGDSDADEDGAELVATDNSALDRTADPRNDNP